jgi:hypothetical protein
VRSASTAVLAALTVTVLTVVPCAAVGRAPGPAASGGPAAPGGPSAPGSAGAAGAEDAGALLTRLKDLYRQAEQAD